MLLEIDRIGAVVTVGIVNNHTDTRCGVNKASIENRHLFQSFFLSLSLFI